jgi:DNA-directed RNA polymerase subunit RPC12/RpoP
MPGPSRAEAEVIELDEETWMEAAREYQRVRRFVMTLSFACFGLFFGFIISFFLAVALDAHPGIPTVLFLLFLPAFGLCGLACWFASLELTAFRCPRCGKLFTMAWWSTGPGNRCKHCRLDLSLRPKPKPKAVKAGHLLE